MKEKLNKMKKSIESSIEYIELLLPYLDKEIKEVINSKTKDKMEIERILDFIMYPQTEKQFYRLLNYYKKIDEKAAKDYERYYKETYE